MVEWKASLIPPLLRIYTKAWNRPLSRLSRGGMWDCWFTLGVNMSVVLMIPCIFLAMIAPYLSQDDSRPTPVLEPAVPGVTLPIGDCAYFVSCLILSSILHEMGHAVAAFREGVAVAGSGIMFFFFLPAAFVDLNTEEMMSLPPARQLRVYCAGVWHSIASALLALVVLLSLPFILFPLYMINAGALVLSVQEGSGLSGVTGLQPGAVVTSIDDCQVTGVWKWNECVSRSHETDGFCFPLSVVRSLDDQTQRERVMKDNSVECCPADSSSHLCFHYEEGTLMHPYSCLPARPLLASRSSRCSSSCHADSVCLHPPQTNTTRLLEISVSHGRSVIFLGPPDELFRSAQLSDYVPRFTFLHYQLPEVLVTFLKYLIALSGGLTVFNIIPCIGLDGKWICNALVASHIKDKNIQVLVSTVLISFGTFLVFLNVFVGFWRLL